MALRVSNGLGFALLAGFFAALASVFAKIAFDSRHIRMSVCEEDGESMLKQPPMHQNPGPSIFAMASFHCENVTILLRALCASIMLLSNILMFRSFSKSLLLCGSAAEATTINTAANFCFSGIFGWLLFNEKFSQTWLIGTCTILIGIAVVNSSKEAAEKEHMATLCFGLPDTYLRDPWDCSRCISCMDQISTFGRCQNNLVFHPYKFRCVYSWELPCEIVYTSNAAPAASSDPTGRAGGKIPNSDAHACLKSKDRSVDEIRAYFQCSGKPIKQYAIPDTFRYLECTNNISYIHNCPNDQVYIGGEERCRTVNDSDKKNFCRELLDGKYRNPWNCSSYIFCLNYTKYVIPCKKGYNAYDPYQDKCVPFQQFPCITV